MQSLRLNENLKRCWPDKIVSMYGQTDNPNFVVWVYNKTAEKRFGFLTNVSPISSFEIEPKTCSCGICRLAQILRDTTCKNNFRCKGGCGLISQFWAKTLENGQW